MTIFREDGALDVRFDLFYGSRWNEIPNEDTRNSLAADGEVRITRGRPNEAGQTQPAACSLAVSDFDGKYSLRNPFSPLFGLIGLNTPLRVRLAGSTFEVPPTASIRSKTIFTDDDPGDPPAPVGLQPGDVMLLFITINLSGSGSERVPGMLQRMGLPRGGAPWQEIAGVESLDLSISLSEATVGATKVFWKIAGPSEPATYDINSVTPGPQSFNVVILAVQNASHVRPQTITIAELPFGTTITTPASLPGTPNLELRWIAAHGDFDETTTPLTWTTPAGFTEEAGFYGLGFDDLAVNGVLASRALASVGDTGEHVFTCNSQIAYRTGVTVNVLSNTAPLRATTEIAEWPPRWIESSINAPVDKGAGDVWVPLQAAGILRRLGQGAKPLKSTLFRVHLASEDVVFTQSSVASLEAYWPLEDTFGATQLASPLMGVEPGLFSGAITVGSASPAPGSASVVRLDDTTAEVNFPSIPRFPPDWTVFNTWIMSFVFAHSDSEPISTNILDFEIGEAPTVFWVIDVRTNSTGDGLDWSLFREVRLIDTSSSTLIDTGISALADVYYVEVQKTTNVLSVNVNGVQNVLLTPGGGQQIEQPSRIVFFGQSAELLLLGHVGVWAIGNISKSDAMPDVQAAIDAYTREAAGRRVERLCFEETIPFYAVGDLDDTAFMGPQPITELLTALRECETLDLGILYEPRDQVGLVYRARVSLYNQAPVLELTPGAAGEVVQPLTPTDDDQQLRNDVTVTRTGGGSTRVFQETGPLSVEDPPNGVRVYDTEVRVNALSVLDLPDQAGERLRLGTVNEARYPNIVLDLLALDEYGRSDLLLGAAQLDSGDRLTIDQPPPWLPLELIDQLALGFTESLREFGWDVSTNNAPEKPYGEIAQYAGASEELPPDASGRYDTAGTRTIRDFQVGVDTQLDVETFLGQLWTTDTADLPFDIELAGVQLRVTQVITNQPSLRSVSSVATGTTESFNISAPAGLQPGDVLISFHATDTGAPVTGNFTNSQDGNPWLLLTEGTSEDGSGGVRVHWKIAANNEPATYSGSQDPSADGVVAIAAVVSGRSVTLDARTTARIGSSTLLPTESTGPISTSFELRWASFEANATPATLSPPSGFTEQAEENSGNFIIGALATRNSPAPPHDTGRFDFTSSILAADRSGVTVNVIGTQTMVVEQQPINGRPGDTKLVLTDEPVALRSQTRYGL